MNTTLARITTDFFSKEKLKQIKQAHKSKYLGIMFIISILLDSRKDKTVE